MMTTVRLYGHLADEFGAVHQFDVASPQEAIDALKANFKGFFEAVYGTGSEYYRVFVDHLNKSDKLELSFQFRPGKHVVKIVPVVVGAGGKAGMGQAILGAVLVVAGAVAQFGYGQAWGTSLMRIGAGMMIGGVASMLAANPRIGKMGAQEEKRKQSYLYQGPATTAGLGTCVPVVYGIVECPPVVVAKGLYAEAYDTFTSNNEPTSGFRIVAPLGVKVYYPADGETTVASESFSIEFASAVGISTAQIKSQASDVKGFNPAFKLAGDPGSQVLSCATTLPLGVHTCLLSAKDESGNSTEKLITLKVVEVQRGGGDTDPHLKDPFGNEIASTPEVISN